MTLKLPISLDTALDMLATIEKDVGLSDDFVVVRDSLIQAREMAELSTDEVTPVINEVVGLGVLKLYELLIESMREDMADATALAFNWGNEG